MSKTINFTTRGWKFTENKGLFYGVNYMEATEDCSYENHSIRLEFRVCFMYDLSEKEAQYWVNPVIKYNGTSYNILFDLVCRNLDNMDLNEVLLSLGKRMKDSYIIEESDMEYSEFHWGGKHNIGIGKPSDNHPTDILYRMEPDSEVNSTCIKMGKLMEHKKGKFDVPVVLDGPTSLGYPRNITAICCKK